MLSLVANSRATWSSSASNWITKSGLMFASCSVWMERKAATIKTWSWIVASVWTFLFNEGPDATITASLTPLTDSWCMLGAFAMRGKFFSRFFDHDAPNLLAVIVLAIRFFLPFRIASAKWLFVSVRNFGSSEQGTVMTCSAGVWSLAKAISTFLIVRQTTMLAVEWWLKAPLSMHLWWS